VLIYGGRRQGIWLPMVVAVNGICAGGGLHFLSEADVVLAAESATFLDPHVSVGQVAGLEMVSLLNRMSLQALLRTMVVGKHEPMSATRALECGLVSEVVADDQLLDRALALARLVAWNSPSAIEASKKIIYGAWDVMMREQLGEAWDGVRAHWGHPDQTEGIAAFADSREPHWACRPEPAAG
jgi:enoyl-CoA hydratase/carnithine racemase